MVNITNGSDVPEYPSIPYEMFWGIIVRETDFVLTCTCWKLMWQMFIQWFIWKKQSYCWMLAKYHIFRHIFYFKLYKCMQFLWKLSQWYFSSMAAQHLCISLAIRLKINVLNLTELEEIQNIFYQANNCCFVEECTYEKKF